MQKLDQKFNYKQFAVDSTTNQTGNLISIAGGATAMALAIFIAPAAVAGAPLILLGLFGSVVAGVAYSLSGADKQVNKAAKDALGVK